MANGTVLFKRLSSQQGKKWLTLRRISDELKAAILSYSEEETA